MNYTGINMEDVKRRNRATILGIIAREGSVSRKKISEITGLTPASVTLLCNEMITQKMLIETGTISSTKGAGRKQILLELNADFCSILAINIESENTFIVLTDLKSTLLDKSVMKTERNLAPEKYLQKIVKECQSILQKHPKEAAHLSGAAVCVPGIVNKKTGVSVHAFSVWDEEVPVCAILHDLLNVPVIIENNVNALAFAELFYDRSTNKKNFMLIKWGPGVGSAIVINQQVYEGRAGKTAELGHVIVEKEGQRCSCGKKGCLETIVSYQALSRIIPFSMEDLDSAYQKATAQQRHEIDDALDIFARIITNCMILAAPDKVVLCGKMFHSEGIRNKLMDLCYAYNPACPRERIIYTELRETEEYIGPVACFIQNQLFQ